MAQPRYLSQEDEAAVRDGFARLAQYDNYTRTKTLSEHVFIDDFLAEVAPAMSRRLASIIWKTVALDNWSLGEDHFVELLKLVRAGDEGDKLRVAFLIIQKVSSNERWIQQQVVTPRAISIFLKVVGEDSFFPEPCAPSPASDVSDGGSSVDALSDDDDEAPPSRAGRRHGDSLDAPARGDDAQYADADAARDAHRGPPRPRLDGAANAARPAPRARAAARRRDDAYAPQQQPPRGARRGAAGRGRGAQAAASLPLAEEIAHALGVYNIHDEVWQNAFINLLLSDEAYDDAAAAQFAPQHQHEQLRATSRRALREVRRRLLDFVGQMDQWIAPRSARPRPRRNDDTDVDTAPDAAPPPPVAGPGRLTPPSGHYGDYADDVAPDAAGPPRVLAARPPATPPRESPREGLAPSGAERAAALAALRAPSAALGLPPLAEAARGSRAAPAADAPDDVAARLFRSLQDNSDSGAVDVVTFLRHLAAPAGAPRGGHDGLSLDDDSARRLFGVLDADGVGVVHREAFAANLHCCVGPVTEGTVAAEAVLCGAVGVHPGALRAAVEDCCYFKLANAPLPPDAAAEERVVRMRLRHAAGTLVNGQAGHAGNMWYAVPMQWWDAWGQWVADPYTHARPPDIDCSNLCRSREVASDTRGKIVTESHARGLCRTAVQGRDYNFVSHAIFVTLAQLHHIVGEPLTRKALPADGADGAETSVALHPPRCLATSDRCARGVRVACSMGQDLQAVARHAYKQLVVVQEHSANQPKSFLNPSSESRRILRVWLVRPHHATDLLVYYGAPLALSATEPHRTTAEWTTPVATLLERDYAAKHRRRREAPAVDEESVGDAKDVHNLTLGDVPMDEDSPARPRDVALTDDDDDDAARAPRRAEPRHALALSDEPAAKALRQVDLWTNQGRQAEARRPEPEPEAEESDDEDDCIELRFEDDDSDSDDDATKHSGGRRRRSATLERAALDEDAKQAGAAGLGEVGLRNLGNTCYMNAVLQALAHVPPLRAYFASGEFAFDINVESKFGARGKLAAAFGELLRHLSESREAITPEQFKRTLGAWDSTFAGYAQQDASELLQKLLEGLGEDLNRVAEKPYVDNPDVTSAGGDALDDRDDSDCESAATERRKRSKVDDQANQRVETSIAAECWRNHASLREDHPVTALFGGQTRRETVCDEDSRERLVSFEEFTMLTVPLYDNDDAERETLGVRCRVRFHKHRLWVLDCVVYVKLDATVDDVLAAVAALRLKSDCADVALRLDDASLDARDLVAMLPPHKGGADRAVDAAVQVLPGNAKARDFEAAISSQSKYGRLDVYEVPRHAGAPRGRRRRAAPPRRRVIDDDDDDDWSGASPEVAVSDGDAAPSSSSDDEDCVCICTLRTISDVEQYFIEKGRLHFLYEPFLVRVSGGTTGRELHAAVWDHLRPFLDSVPDAMHAAAPFFTLKRFANPRTSPRARVAAQSLAGSEMLLPGAGDFVTDDLVELDFDLFEGGAMVVVDVPRAGVRRFNDRALRHVVQHVSCQPRPPRPPVPLLECVRSYCAPTKVTKYSKAATDRAGGEYTEVPFTKALSIWRPPPFLALVLERFFVTERGRKRKLSDRVAFPVDGLDISEFCHDNSEYKRHVANAGHRTPQRASGGDTPETVHSHDDMEVSDCADTPGPPPPPPPPPPMYDLVSVVNHFGGLEHGHYTCIARRLDNAGWLEFDDRRVESLNLGAVCDDPAAYVLFYARRDTFCPAAAASAAGPAPVGPAPTAGFAAPTAGFAATAGPAPGDACTPLSFLRSRFGRVRPERMDVDKLLGDAADDDRAIGPKEGPLLRLTAGAAQGRTRAASVADEDDDEPPDLEATDDDAAGNTSPPLRGYSPPPSPDAAGPYDAAASPTYPASPTYATYAESPSRAPPPGRDGQRHYDVDDQAVYPHPHDLRASFDEREDDASPPRRGRSDDADVDAQDDMYS